MAGTFILPLCPLRHTVLLPGETVHFQTQEASWRDAVEAARDFGGMLAVSLADGESVHEVGVTAMIDEQENGSASLHGVDRCRLLGLVNEDVPLVRVERYPESSAGRERSQPLAGLLLRRYHRLCETLGRTPLTTPGRALLSSLTWQVTAGLELTPEQQQGFLNVPDPVTRGKLLLLVVREIEKRERFLRNWSHLRTTSSWN
jgi:Lon protease-like protein